MIEQLWQKINSSWFEILLGFLIPIILGSIKLIIDRIIINNQMKNSLSLKGIWFSYHKNCYDEEIIKFKHKKNNEISYKIKYYNKNQNRHSLFSGIGIINGSNLNLIYCSENTSSSQNGSIMLKLITVPGSSDILKGYYFEYVDEPRKSKLIDYHLKKFENNAIQKRVWLSKSYDEVDECINGK